MCLVPIIILAICLSCGAVSADELSTFKRSLIQLQQSERLVASAIHVKDGFELKQQSEALVFLSAEILSHSISKSYSDCSSASLSLSGIAFFSDQRQRFGSISASDQIEFSEQREAFPISMSKCESMVGLEPPRRPNLR